MNAQSIFKSEQIPAGQSKAYAVTGSSFYIQAASGLVDVQFDDSPNLRMAPGQSAESDPGDTYEKITLTNPDTSSALTITFYAGTLAVGTRTPYTFVKPAPTYFVPYTYSVTKAAQTVPPITNLRAGKSVADTMSHVIITFNTSTSDGLWIENVSATVGMVIPFATPIQLTLRDQFYLRNASGSATDPLTVRVMIFYNYDS